MSKERTAFMGVPVDAITMQETIRRIHNSIEQGEKIQHMAINTMIILRMVEDPEFMHTLSKCEVINADGIGVVWASKKLLGRPLPERVTGIDLMEALIGLAAEHGFKPYFLGCSRGSRTANGVSLSSKVPQARNSWVSKWIFQGVG